MDWLNQQHEKKVQYLTLTVPGLMEQVMMLIHSGVHPRNSLIQAFAQVEENPILEDSAKQLVLALKSGMPLEGALLSFNLSVKYKPLGKMLQRVVLYEKTGNDLLLSQLTQDVIELHQLKLKYRLDKINRADLVALAPSFIHLFIMMAMLMSPMLIGGMTFAN